MNVSVFYRLEAIWLDRVMGNRPSSIRMRQPQQQKVRIERVFFYRLEAIWVDRVMGNVPSSIRMWQPQQQKVRIERVFLSTRSHLGG
jgi:hypothetical protein